MEFVDSSNQMILRCLVMKIILRLISSHLLCTNEMYFSGSN